MLISMLTSSVMGIKRFNSTMKLIQQRLKETLQLTKCVGKDVNFNGNKCSYGYKNISIPQLS